MMKISWWKSWNLYLDIQQLIGRGNDLAQQLNLRLHVNEMKNKELNQTRETYLWAGKGQNLNVPIAIRAFC